MTTEGSVGAPSPVSAIVDEALAITDEETDVVQAVIAWRR